MATPLHAPTPLEIDQIIRDSGYPFELEVGLALQNSGYEVQLSHQYFNVARQRTGEVDIRATRDFVEDTHHAGRVRRVLELIVECKDNKLPYVLFGFSAPEPPTPGMLDADVYYSKLRSYQDDFANQLALISLGDGRIAGSENFKKQHHQFAQSFRFHQASAVEPKDKNFKLNVSNRLRDSLHGLAGYVQCVQDTVVKANKVLRGAGMPHDPTVWVSFLLLIHRGMHYRYTGTDSLTSAPYTTLFTSLHDNDISMPYTVDFIKFSALPDALVNIERTFDLVSKHIIRYLKRSPNPLPR